MGVKYKNVDQGNKKKLPQIPTVCQPLNQCKINRKKAAFWGSLYVV